MYSLNNLKDLIFIYLFIFFLYRTVSIHQVFLFKLKMLVNITANITSLNGILRNPESGFVLFHIVHKV